MSIVIRPKEARRGIGTPYASSQSGHDLPIWHKIDPRELTRSLQFELKRIGCLTGQVNGQFDNKTRGAISEFGKITSKEVSSSKEPTIELVKLVRTFEKRVCPVRHK